MAISDFFVLVQGEELTSQIRQSGSGVGVDAVTDNEEGAELATRHVDGGGHVVGRRPAQQRADIDDRDLVTRTPAQGWRATASS